MEDDPSTRARRVYHMGNLLQKRGEVKEAAKMYRSAVKLDPSHKASHYNLGEFLPAGAVFLPLRRLASATEIALGVCVCIYIRDR